MAAGQSAGSDWVATEFSTALAMKLRPSQIGHLSSGLIGSLVRRIVAI
jgi:hypothetical protein